MYNPEMLTADTAGAHNSILTVAVRVLLAIFPKAAVLAAFMLSGVLVLNADAEWLKEEKAELRATYMQFCDGSGPLICAIAKGDAAEIKRLAAEGTDVNYTILGNPVIMVIESGQPDLLNHLIDAGANVNMTGGRMVGFYPMHYAAMFNDYQAITILAAAGADINVMDPENGTPLFLATFAENLQAVNALIASGADVNLAHEKKMAPLALAASNGNVQLVNIFINAGSDINAPIPFNPLLVASAEGHMQIISVLIAAGVDINKPVGGERTVLDIAVAAGMTTAITALIASGADVNKVGEDGFNPLILAMKYDQTAAISALIAAGVNVNQGVGDLSPIHMAVFKNMKIMNILISAGANVNNKADGNVTPLHLAAKDENVEAVFALVKAGAKILPDKSGRTPIDWAEREHGKDSTIATFLREVAKRETSASKKEAQELLKRLEKD